MIPFHQFTHAKKLTFPAPANSVVFVYMPWCGPSQAAAPLFDLAVDKRVSFFYHDNSDHRLPVRMFPTLIGYNSMKRARTDWDANDFRGELMRAIEYAKQ
jgi:thiol-disulfide isomerase/thioredoxin